MRIEHYDADTQAVVPLEAYRVHQTVVAEERAKKAERDLALARAEVERLREQNERLTDALKSARPELERRYREAWKKYLGEQGVEVEE